MIAIAQGSFPLLACCVMTSGAATNSSFNSLFSQYLKDNDVPAAVQNASRQYELGADLFWLHAKWPTVELHVLNSIGPGKVGNASTISRVIDAASMEVFFWRS